MSKANLDPDVLRDLYITQDLTKTEIAKILHRDIGTVDRALKKHNITKECKSRRITREDLEELYIRQNLSAEEISRKFSVDSRTILRRLEELGIKKSKEKIDEARCDTFEKKYGKRYPGQVEEFKDKIAEINIQKYGVKCNLMDEKTKEQIRATNLSKYGVENPAQNREIYDKIRQTNLERYGFENSHQNEEVKAKTKMTFLQKYGVENSLQDESVREKIRQTMIKKYGVENNTQRHLSADALLTVSSEENLRKFIECNNIITTTQLANALGYGLSRMRIILHKFDLYDLLDHNESTPEQEVRDFISSLGVEVVRDRSILNGKEIDIYCPDYKIGIEFNGTYWHSSICKDRDYHFWKSSSAAENGVHLIHIYEYEWTDDRVRPIIESVLRLAFGKIQNRIYARKCEVREITNADARAFVDENHIQGHRNAKVTLGLFYQEELVQLMSFSHNKTYEWEIIRSCPKMNTMIVGGISKLFTYFVQKYAPNEVFSYADFNKFDGHGYESLGMKFIGYTGPDMKWLINNRVYNRNPSKHAEMKEMADAQIFGAGSKKFLWKK